MVRAQEGPRARYREQTRSEIKKTALRQLAESGAGALALTRVAKEMGLSGPALYRYFAGRDDLLSALIRDAYDDAAAAVGRAADAAGTHGAGPRERLRTLAAAYRAWAVAEPHRYLLIQGAPVPGYVAPDDTRDRARAVLGPFLPVFASGTPGSGVAALVVEMTDWLAGDESVGAWVADYAPDALGDLRRPSYALAGAVLVWAQLHGSVGLEAAGQFDGMGHSGDTLLVTQMNLLADAFALS
ncbi:TetR/AcrR family transcriptional regulator [Streptomyces sp. NRRL WC-3549]|uniref:TetR/AcrR family transcriptional regulator n=1 Tax=Streptomyces sp. NRRL WC-3549 TaxID=1463925 RepID=UPI0004CA3B96|nr:TetR/AcrR family transcriptional regulator [Streptomyces sp. NRRL WC-3549]